MLGSGALAGARETCAPETSASKSDRHPNPPLADSDVRQRAGGTGAEIMVSSQFSYYNGDPTGSWLYNSCRSMEHYRLAVEAGFPVVALDTPPVGMDWYLADYVTFIKRNEVKCVAFSLQTLRLSAYHIKAARDFHAALPDDVSVLFFGTNTAPAMIQLARSYAGRNMAFSNAEPAAKAHFGRLVTGALAGYKKKARCPVHRAKNKIETAACECVSVGMSKAEVFQWNTQLMGRWADKALDVSVRTSARGAVARRKRQGRSR